MTRFVNAALIAMGIVFACPLLLMAQPQPPATGSPRANACSLVPKEEVKRYLPWESHFDHLPTEEEPIGTSGSSCGYPSVFIQIMPFSQPLIDSARKRGALDTIGGIGNEAYFYNNPNGHAELYVKIGKRLLTLQANVHGNVESVKPGVLRLAKVLVEKLN
jgi:hypothetical protein